MNKCPCCNEFALEYDTYFKRDRCFSYGWIPRSNVEIELSRQGLDNTYDTDNIELLKHHIKMLEAEVIYYKEKA